MATGLTPNAILALNSGDVELRPLVQVLDVRQIGTAQSVQERYRLVLSDGNYVQQAMLATQLNDYVKSGQLQKGTIVRLQEYICNTVQQRKIIIVLNMEVVTVVCDIIGDPKQVIATDQSVPPLKPATASSYQPAPAVAATASAYQNSSPYSNRGTLAKNELSSVSKSTTAAAFQPPPVYSTRGPIAKNEAPARIIPIAALNPYQGRWTIKARVTAKGDLRRFNNAKGDGKVFHFDLLDAEGGEIRVTCFNTVAEQFYDRIEVGKVYMISKGSLKAAQRNFNHLKNEWEIFLESSSIVECCYEEDDSIPHQQFDFRLISEIESMQGNMMIDVLGVVVAINPSNTIMRKNGTETEKRTLQMRDGSGRTVELTLWGAFCMKEGQHLQELCDSGQFPVLAVKAGRISDFSGKSIGTISTTQLLINPNLPEAHELRQWFELEGKNTMSQSISKEFGNSNVRIEMRKTVSQIKDEGLGRSEKPDWIAVKVTISFIKTDTFCYTACPLLVGDRQCNKKVTNNGDGTWRCDRCDKSVPECDFRYLLSIQVQDHTGVTWLTAFQEAAEEVMGVTAKELYMWHQDDNLKFSDVIQKLLFCQHLFKLKIKEENFNDEQRVKCTIVKSERLDYASESRVLIDLIGKLTVGDSVPIAAATTTGGANTYYGSSSMSYANSSAAGNESFGLQGGSQFRGGNNTYYGNPSRLNGGYNTGERSTMNTGSSYCSKCGKGGHLPRDCPGDMGGRHQGVSFGGGFNAGVSGSSANSCFKCGQGGHWARDCPSQGGGGGFGGSYSGSGGYSRVH